MAKGKVVDLSSIDTVQGSNDGFDVRIYHPGTTEDLDIVISVLGKDSDEFQKITRSQSRRRIAKVQKGGFRSPTVPVEEVEQNGIELLAACTTGWKTLAVKGGKGESPEPEKKTILLDGSELEFSVAAAESLYERFPWIKEQVDTAIGDRANFIKA